MTHREPKKKVKGQGKTYYHVKDINFLAHEPLLDTFRALRAYERKIKKQKRSRRTTSSTVWRNASPSTDWTTS